MSKHKKKKPDGFNVLQNEEEVNAILDLGKSSAIYKNPKKCDLANKSGPATSLAPPPAPICPKQGGRSSSPPDPQALKTNQNAKIVFTDDDNDEQLSVAEIARNCSKLAKSTTIRPTPVTKGSNTSTPSTAMAAPQSSSSSKVSNLGVKTGKLSANGLSVVVEENGDQDSSNTLGEDDSSDEEEDASSVADSADSATSSSDEEEETPVAVPALKPNQRVKALPAAANTDLPAAARSLPAATNSDPLHQVKPVWRSLFAENRKSGNGMKLHKVEGLKGMKRIKLTKKHEKAPNSSWEHGLIGYIAGNNIGKGAIINYCNSWKLKYKIYFDLSGWIGIKFENEDDKMNVLNLGPHLIFGRPFFLKVIPPYFAFEDEEMKQVPVWIKLPKLPFIFWNEEAISAIFSTIGTPIQSDVITQKGEGFSYALGLVEIDVSEKLEKVIELELECGKIIEQRIDYEYVPGYCNVCKAVGHTIANCPRSKEHSARAEIQVTRAEIRTAQQQTREKQVANTPSTVLNTCDRCKLMGHTKETCRVNINTCDRCKRKGHDKETCKRKNQVEVVIVGTSKGTKNVEDPKGNEEPGSEEEVEAARNCGQGGQNPFISETTKTGKGKDRRKRKEQLGT